MKGFAYLVFIFIFTVPEGLGAELCDCSLKRSVAEEFGAAYAIFVGTLSAELPMDPALEHEIRGFGKQTLLFTVEAGYKHVSTDTIKLMSRSNSSCAFSFLVGETYLIYAFRTIQGELHTYLCSRTAQIDEAWDDINALPEPTYIRERR